MTNQRVKKERRGLRTVLVEWNFPDRRPPTADFYRIHTKTAVGLRPQALFSTAKGLLGQRRSNFFTRGRQGWVQINKTI